MSEPAVTVTGLSVWRQRAGAATPVLRGLDLSVERGERVALIGANGVGKTSLLLALLGAVPFDGEIRIGAQKLERTTLEPLRRNMGFVFSDPQDQLFLSSVHDEVAFGPLQRGVREPELGARVRSALARVRLDGFEARSPAELSLGEQRRLAVATILSYEPELLLIDEPTASLDPRARRNILEILVALQKTVLFATHDLDAALDLKARVVLLGDGRIIADGPAERLLRDEALLHAAGLELPLTLTCRGAG